MFSCTSMSNKRIKLKKNESSKIVNFEECLINQGKAFDPQSGVFQAQEDGIYEFSATFLMKTDFAGQIQVGLKHNQIIVNQAVLQSPQGLKIGMTNSMTNNLKVVKGDTVFLELMSADGSGGLINSDWLVLKFSAYKKEELKELKTRSGMLVIDFTPKSDLNQKKLKIAVNFEKAP